MKYEESVTRPWTPDIVGLDGVTSFVLKRCCNGCGRALGDVTDAELDAAMAGRSLPDVQDECGCGRYVPLELKDAPENCDGNPELRGEAS